MIIEHCANGQALPGAARNRRSALPVVGQRFQRRPELVRYAKVYSGRIVGTPPVLPLCPPCHGWGFPSGGFWCDLVSPKIRRNGAIIKPRQGLVRRYVQGRNNCV